MTKIDEIIKRKTAKPDDDKRIPLTPLKPKLKHPTASFPLSGAEAEPESELKSERRRVKLKTLKVWPDGVKQTSEPEPSLKDSGDIKRVEDTGMENIDDAIIESIDAVIENIAPKPKPKTTKAKENYMDINAMPASNEQNGGMNEVGSEFIIITGIYDELKRQNVPLLPVGCGKTLYATYMGYESWYKYGRQVFTTYHTTFSKHVSPEEFMDLYSQNEVMPGDLFIIDEIDRWLSPQSKRGGSGAMLQQCISIRRQMQINMIGTCQRFMDVVKWTRDQATRILVVQKFHPPPSWANKKGANGGMKRDAYNTMPDQCLLESCPRKHIIIAFEVYNDGRDIRPPIQHDPIDTDKYGKLYDTHEIVAHSIDDLFFRLAKEKKMKNKLAAEMDVPSFSKPKTKKVRG